jgi:hypothetical protein
MWILKRAKKRDSGQNKEIKKLKKLSKSIKRWYLINAHPLNKESV